MTTTNQTTTTHASTLLDAEVQPATTRPSWTAAEKLAILTEYDSYPRGAPERGALLRRQGIYTSHISKWRTQCNRAAVAALTPQPRGPKPAPHDPLVDEVARLQRHIARLQAQLDQATIVIDVQKKVAQLLGTPLLTSPADDQ